MMLSEHVRDTAWELRNRKKDKSDSKKYYCLNDHPLKGRKKKGGISFDEMERDSLLAHGCSFLLHDRLLNCSDKYVAVICTGCGSYSRLDLRRLMSQLVRVEKNVNQW